MVALAERISERAAVILSSSEQNFDFLLYD